MQECLSAQGGVPHLQSHFNAGVVTHHRLIQAHPLQSLEASAERRKVRGDIGNKRPEALMFGSAGGLEFVILQPLLVHFIQVFLDI